MQKTLIVNGNSHEIMALFVLINYKSNLDYYPQVEI